MLSPLGRRWCDRDRDVPGLSSNIAQAEPILMRTGATSFQSSTGIRLGPGTPGELHAGGQRERASWSAPSCTATRQPHHGALRRRRWCRWWCRRLQSLRRLHVEWAHYSAGSDSLTVEGSLFAGSNIYRQGVFDSADAMSAARTSCGSARATSSDSPSRTTGSGKPPPEGDLTNQGCSAAPHITRVGTLGLFLTCAQAGATAYLRVVDLYTSCGDGVADPSEACDDGNNDNGDGCSSTCTL